MLYNLFEDRDFVSVFAVALLAEGVDRNLSALRVTSGPSVALLAEGVDRNVMSTVAFGLTTVALLAEGVDRNLSASAQAFFRERRPPRGGRG